MKICPRCNISHNKNGTYCSRSCGNVRIRTEDDKKRISEKLKEYYKTNDGLERKKKISSEMTIIMSKEERKKLQSEKVKSSFTKERKKQYSERQKGKKLSEETKKKLSVAAKNNELGGHTSKRKMKYQKVDGSIIYLQSNYEILLAEMLDKLNIEWIRPSPFIWIDDNNVSHRYYPDFKIGDIFIDTKNDYLIKKDEVKIRKVEEQNNIKIIILSKKEITEDYIRQLV
jgi:hypothetical protein